MTPTTRTPVPQAPSDTTAGPAAAPAGERPRPAPPRRRLTDRKRITRLSERTLAIALIAVTAIACVVPVFYLFQRALVNGGGGVRRMVDDPRFGKVLLTTVGLAVGAVIFSMVVGTALAWWANSLPRRRRWMGLLPLLPLLVPQLALVTGYAFLLSPKVGYVNQLLRATPFFSGRTGPLDAYTVPWMIIIMGLGMAAFVFLFVRGALANLHQDLLDAAAAAGARPSRAFWQVVIPLLRPALIYGCLTVTLLGLGQFTVPLILGRQVGTSVLTTEMYYHASASVPDYGLVSAYGFPILVIGIVFLIGQRLLLRDQGRFVMSSGRPTRPKQDGGRWAQAALVTYALVTVILPLIGLLIVSFQPFWSGKVVPSDFTLENYRTVFGRSDLTQAIRHSLLYGFYAMLIALPVGYICARTIYRRQRKPYLASAQETVVSLPLGIPAVILGAGFLLAYLDSPIKLYSTDLGVVLVYVVIMLPFVTRLLLVSMLNLGEDLSNAAAANGAGLLRRTFTIDLPLLRPALAGAAALVIVLSTHEFSASVLVRSGQTQVMGTVLFDLWSYGSFPAAAVMGLLMCLVTAAGVGLVLLLGGTAPLKRWRDRGAVDV